jgi:tetratricopeptide (TPR) repeat protein
MLIVWRLNLVSQTNTQADRESVIPIGRRIGEVMESKGGAFTQRAFAPRIGLSKDTLGRIISGERAVMNQEIERIANGLSISVSRLKQEDTSKARTQLLSLLSSKEDPSQAVELANRVYSVSLGITEKCDSSLNLARAIYALGDYDRSHDLLLDAYQLAERLYEKHGETDLLYEVLSKLMTTYAIRKEFSALSEVLTKVEKVFESSPEKQGAICFSQAMIAEHFQDVEQTRELLVKSLEFFVLTDKKNDIGRAEMSVGYFEFKQRNYLTAKQYLQRAVRNLENDVLFRFISVKELVKVLLMTGETSDAIQLLEKRIPELTHHPDLQSKFAIMLSIATGDPHHAESVLTAKGVGDKVLQITCKFLTKHYLKLGDVEAAMKYAILADRHALNPSEILHEEDL